MVDSKEGHADGTIEALAPNSRQRRFAPASVDSIRCALMSVTQATMPRGGIDMATKATTSGKTKSVKSLDVNKAESNKVKGGFAGKPVE